jgi:O-antigen/teichoic acid export membrane protein
MFKKEFYFRSFIFLFETMIIISLIVLNKSISALIFGMIISAAMEVFLSFLIVRPIPRAIFNTNYFKEIINKGKWITGSTIFNYFYQNGGNIAVGKLLGAGSLGLYDMAYKISLAPLNDFADTITKVTFPDYIKIVDDKLRLRKAFLKTFLFIVTIVIPIGIIISLFAKEIIIIILGEKWTEAVPALQILGIFGAIRAVSVFSNSFFLSIQRQNIFMLVNFTALIIMAALLIPLTINFGIFGAGLSALIGTIATLPIIAFFIYKYFYYEK